VTLPITYNGFKTYFFTSVSVFKDFFILRKSFLTKHLLNRVLVLLCTYLA
jgi:hypothetical protein